MKSYIIKKRIIIISLLIGLMLSMFVLDTPKPVNSDVSNKFSAIRAQEHIEVISRKPHSYYDRDELEEVRDYLKDTLTTYLGSENLKSYHYTVDELKDGVLDRSKDKVEYPIENIMGVIPGVNKEGILLMAHYDSRGHVGRQGEMGRSYGAMDDGYGVASLLELAYILKEEKPLNSIYFLFTDAEEVGLFGASMAAKETEIMTNAKFLINLESRGQYGPAYMFETSKNNKKVIDLYKHAKMPVTYSMATAVYSVMPNFTDFSPFIDAGMPGINFATLAGLDYYHSPLDRYENIDITSVQSMGTQTEPIIREFMNDAKYIENGYFDSKSDQVFFTLFTGVLISYTQTFAVIFAVLLLIGFIYLVVMKNYKKEVFTDTLPKGLLLSGVLIIGTLLFTVLTALIEKVDFSITYTRINGIDSFAFIIMVLITLVIFKKLHNKKHYNNTLLIGIGLNTILTLLTTFFLPGASFLFAFTALVGIISFIVQKLEINKIYKHITYIASYTLMLLLIVPLLYSFYMALTIGGLVILVFLLLINGIVTMPIISNHLELGE